MAIVICAKGDLEGLTTKMLSKFTHRETHTLYTTKNRNGFALAASWGQYEAGDKVKLFQIPSELLLWKNPDFRFRFIAHTQNRMDTSNVEKKSQLEGSQREAQIPLSGALGSNLGLLMMTEPERWIYFGVARRETQTQSAKNSDKNQKCHTDKQGDSFFYLPFTTNLSFH